MNGISFNQASFSFYSSECFYRKLIRFCHTMRDFVETVHAIVQKQLSRKRFCCSSVFKKLTGSLYCTEAFLPLTLERL